MEVLRAINDILQPITLILDFKTFQVYSSYS